MKIKSGRLLATLLLISGIIASAVSLSGCSDFSFNPIGKWKLSSDIIYCDGKFFSDEKPGYMKTALNDNSDPSYIYMGDLIYSFGKSGTGTVSVDDGKSVTKTMDFTYTYTDKEVTIHLTDDYYRRNNLDSVEVRYSVENDKNGALILKTQDKYKAQDTSGKQHDFNEVKLLSRL